MCQSIPSRENIVLSSYLCVSLGRRKHSPPVSILNTFPKPFRTETSRSPDVATLEIKKKKKKKFFDL